VSLLALDGYGTKQTMTTNLEALVAAAQSQFSPAQASLVKDILRYGGTGHLSNKFGKVVFNLGKRQVGMRRLRGPVMVGLDGEHREGQKVTTDLASSIQVYTTAMQAATNELIARNEALPDSETVELTHLHDPQISAFVADHRLYLHNGKFHSLTEFTDHNDRVYKAGVKLDSATVLKMLAGATSGEETSFFNIPRPASADPGVSAVSVPQGLESVAIDLPAPVQPQSDSLSFLSPIGYLDELRTAVADYNLLNHEVEGFVPVRMDQLRRVLGIPEGTSHGAHHYSVAVDETGPKLYGPLAFEGVTFAKIVKLTDILARRDTNFQAKAKEIFDENIGFYSQEGDDPLAFAKSRGVRFSYSLKGMISPTSDWESYLTDAIQIEVKARQLAQDAQLLPDIIERVREFAAGQKAEVEGILGGPVEGYEDRVAVVPKADYEGVLADAERALDQAINTGAVADVAILRGELAYSQRELAAAQGNAAALSVAVADHADLLADYRVINPEPSSLAASLAAGLTSARELASLREDTADYATLQVELAELREGTADYATLQGELAEARGQNETYTGRISDLESAAATSRGDFARLAGELSSARARYTGREAVVAAEFAKARLASGELTGAALVRVAQYIVNHAAAEQDDTPPLTQSEITSAAAGLGYNTSGLPPANTNVDF